MKSPRIVFMGTPDFAVASLKALVEKKYNIVGVITAPDKPAGRGRKINTSAVKKYAESVGLNLLQPEKLRDEAFLKELKSLNADLQIVVAFRMLPKVVWDMPKLGTFNLHASLLPQYRGAAPINWAVINGETKTGVTTFLLDDKIDEGNILLQQEVEIGIKDDAGVVHDRLMDVGTDLILKTVDGLVEGILTPTKQIESKDLKPAPKIFKEECKIDWNKEIMSIYNHIRGLSPFPGSWSKLNNGETDTEVKILKSNFVIEDHNLDIGRVITDKKSIRIAVNNGFIDVLELQISGKKRMKSADLLNGYKFDESAKTY
jgi:methionyl-tRNA formyltransferase